MIQSFHPRMSANSFSSRSRSDTMRSGQGPSQFRDLQEKAEEINLVLLQPNVDLWKLRELALTEGGLVNGTFPVTEAAAESLSSRAHHTNKGTSSSPILCEYSSFYLI